ncbi:MAG: ABC-F family ATP-binding cassette domain-containing protein [Clostridia bacterium]|nr:ABC-F family ATP-binding cassette domain-containing protein [Clostridia bacterium]
MLISAHDIGKSFSDNLIFKNVTLTIEDKCRYGLIGVNGAGKSTLLSVLLGELENDEGELYIKNDIRLGVLKQNSGLERDNSIIAEMRKAFDDVYEAERDMRDIEAKMSALSDHESPEYRRLAAAYGAKQAYFDSRDGYGVEVKIKTVLNGMGFSDRDLDTPINILSGGEKTRLAIAKLLLEEPELLVLDEPTNHLDFKTLSWLEEYLCDYKGAIFVISHDRYFLDKIVDNIFELERGRLNYYKGNYSAYQIQKEERLVRSIKEYEAQREEIARLQTYVDKNMARASTSASAKSRLKILESMEILEDPEHYDKKIKLRFEKTKEPYKDVLTVKNLTVTVGEERKELCKNINLEIKRGEKIAVIGDNGIGKSSFFKTIQGLIPHYDGEVEWGKNVSISYYEQENLNLDQNRQAIDELWDRFPHIPEAQIRRMLGNVLLTKEDVYKPVGVISGGERARLALCIIMLEKSNVLLLDEPTNHLDLNSKEVLDRALDEYDGTVIFISHDRYLLNRVPDKIIEITKDGAVVYDGNYDYYKERVLLNKKKAEENKPQKPVQKSESSYRSKEQRKADVKRKQRIKELENEISYLEEECAQLEAELSSEAVYTSFELTTEKSLLLEEANKKLEECFEEWEKLSEEE